MSTSGILDNGDATSYAHLTVSVPDKWSTDEIGMGAVLYQDYDNVTVSGTEVTNTFFELAVVDEVRVTWDFTHPDYISIYHKHSWWLFTWYVKMNPVCPVSKDYLQAYMDSTDNVTSLNIRCSDGDSTMLLQVGFAGLDADSIEDAWDNVGEIGVYLCIRDVDDTQEANYDVWSLIGQILTFQTPNVSPLLNIFINVPIWICLLIVIVYILDKIVPF